MKFKHMLFCGAVFKDDKNKIRKSRVFKILKILEIRNSSVHFVRRLSDEYHLLQSKSAIKQRFDLFG